MAILSFIGRVNIAVRVATEKYPEARLYEADGVSSQGLTTDPNKIDQLRVVFWNSGNTTVMIESTGWGTFAEPVLIPQPWCDDVFIKWPVDMDLDEANRLRLSAGFTFSFANVTLRNPLGPKRGNPYYIFGVNHMESYIFVDTITGEVHSGN